MPVFQYQSKYALPQFSVDFEPTVDEDIFKLNFLCYSKIKIETSKKITRV